jgi:DNA-binding NarL/FixJ family response regulator
VSIHGPVNVMVVDSGKGESEALNELAREMDVQLVGAHSAFDALELAGTAAGLRVAVVRWSPREPGCLELLETLRRHHPDLAVVLLTDDARPAVIRDAVAACADEIICEPADPEYVREVVENLIAGVELHLTADV